MICIVYIRPKRFAENSLPYFTVPEGETRISCPAFIPGTKDRGLLTRLKREEEELGRMTGWKYRIVERGGRQLRELLTKSNLFSTEFCGRAECMACRDAGKKFDCRRRGIVYETACQGCLDKEGKSRAVYVGESSRSLKERYGEHVDDAKGTKKDSHMRKHWEVHHGGERTSFKVEVVGFYTSAL